MLTEPLHEVVHLEDGRDAPLSAEELLNLGDRAPAVLADLLAVEHENGTNDGAALAHDGVDRAADCGAGGGDVVEDEDALATDGCADGDAALAVVLGFLAVICEANRAAVLAVEQERRARSEGDALVRRSEENVELGERARRERVGDRRSVRGTNGIEDGARSEEAGVEEVGRRAVRAKRAREMGSLE